MSERTTIALVTGANKGIGYEIVVGLGALGWSVGVGARDDRRREAAVEKLRAEGVDAFGVPLDVWFRLGEIYERRLDDPVKAREAYAKVPRDSPRYSDAQRKLTRK